MSSLPSLLHEAWGLGVVPDLSEKVSTHLQSRAGSWVTFQDPCTVKRGAKGTGGRLQGGLRRRTASIGILETRWGALPACMSQHMPW